MSRIDIEARRLVAVFRGISRNTKFNGSTRIVCVHGIELGCK